ncbi:MAG TPA: histidine kinase, partial [Bacteroidia bacterium]|nr:histidine kinase [Bacteroidia bacterium]
LLADVLINAITYCMFIGIGLSVKLIKMWLGSEQKILSLEKENLRANLNNLKNQVSPHFLFNTFNNLYILTKTRPDVAAEMILGFSDLLRYQLTECDKEKVGIEQEMKYIVNFLSLERLRKDRLELFIEYDELQLGGFTIEPLLLITLVENAVKHGSQQMENPFIHIFASRKKNVFVFKIINSKPTVISPGKEKSLGTGLDNLRKRLSLAYPASHQIELINNNSSFSATLQIELK